MEVHIIKKEKIQIMGMKVETLLKDTKEQMIIPKLQQQFNERVYEINGAKQLPVTYGIFIDPPNYNPSTDVFTWVAGVEVSDEFELPEKMIRYEIPEGTYAVLKYTGDIDNAGSAYDRLYNWVKNSSYQLAGTYGFEEYSTIHSAIERKQADFKLHFPVKNK
jgi:AraC family transcriptional regulator